MCGLPGYGPGDLIDFEFSGDTIEVTFSAGIDHPLRLTSPEATGVLVALRALLDVPGMVDPQAARSAIAKIESAAGTAQPRHRVRRRRARTDRERGRRRRASRGARRPGAGDRVLLGIPRHAVQPRRRPHPGGAGGRSQLSGGVVPLRRRGAAVPVRPHRGRVRCSTSRRRRRHRRSQAGPDTSLFDGDPALPSATLLIDRSAAWMFDYYPLRVIRELPDGACEAEMTYASDEWMARFVLGFGSAVRVLEPESLAAGCGSRPSRRLRAYEVGEPAGRLARTSGGDQIGWSTTLALDNRDRGIRAALRCQEAP